MARPARRNRALIIVNDRFSSRDEEEPLQRRLGAFWEGKKLARALSDLGYLVGLHRNCSAARILQLFQEESQAEHGDCFVSILSSHGQEGLVFGNQGRAVHLAQLLHTLDPRNCSALAGKPKILFIQACRGEEKDPGVWVEVDSASQDGDGTFSLLPALPENSAVSFACCPGYGAFRGGGSSWLLETLLRLLQGEERHRELMPFLTLLNGTVARDFEAGGAFSGQKAMPCFVSTLLQEVFPFSGPLRPDP
ncbi:caspase-7-like [Tachyglossus aculeatus]|uniref:caspase-7-like n=1 Tax=Tachyglossus aculeatus TaxID=9261 RepID=UPI0018F522B6|nr:caspase-7-like [Tachyglossus aculeatus]